MLPIAKDGTTLATAISLSSSAASVETDEDQSGVESDYRPGKIVGFSNERVRAHFKASSACPHPVDPQDSSIVPETPQKEARSLPPSPAWPFIVRESDSPEIEYYGEPGPARCSDSPELEIIAGPERGTSAEESTLVDNSAVSALAFS